MTQENNQLPLEPNAEELFPLPPHAQRMHNPYSMANYAFFVAPLLEALSPKTICEIGSELGNNTDFLVDYCRKHHARLIICDPAPSEKPDIMDVATIHKALSLDFLKNAPPLDVVFVDGDHNYEVVLAELTHIGAIEREGGKKPFILLHDVGWPCGRRDFYYDPSKIKAPHPYDLELGLSPFSQNAVENGAAARGYYHKALQSGGARNGVLTAAEDFITSHTGWRMHTTYVINGLALLWHDTSLTNHQAAELKNICEHLDWAAPLFSVLELSRFLSEAKINEAGAIWRQNQDAINFLNSELGKAGAWCDKTKAYIQTLKANEEKQQRIIDSLKAEISRLNSSLK